MTRKVTSTASDRSAYSHTPSERQAPAHTRPCPQAAQADTRSHMALSAGRPVLQAGALSTFSCIGVGLWFCFLVLVFLIPDKGPISFPQEAGSRTGELVFYVAKLMALITSLNPSCLYMELNVTYGPCHKWCRAFSQS